MAPESLTAYVYKLGTNAPSHKEAESVVMSTMSRLRTDYPEIYTGLLTTIEGDRDQFELRLIVGTMLCDHNDNEDQLVEETKKRYRQSTLYNIGLCTQNGDTYRIVLALPGMCETGNRKIELYDDVLASIKKTMDPLDISGKFSESLEIRQLLGSWGCVRRGVLLAGSPGWDGTSTDVVRSKNRGHLVATWNDCNDIVQALLASSPDNTLHGSVCLGTIQTRDGFFGMLKYMTVDTHQRIRDHNNMKKKAQELNRDFFEYLSEEDEFHALAKKHKIRGYIGTDAFLCSAHFDGDGLAETLPEGGVGSTQPYVTQMCRIVPLEFQRLICQEPFEDIDSYILVFYSGHGSRDGNMQIEMNEAIEPEELADVSFEMDIPLFVVLDMCYSALFAERFVAQLDAIGWKGMVLTANDKETSAGLSFEAESMAAVRKPSWPVSFNKPDWSKGRGVFTSAFLQSLLYLYETEQSTGSPYTVDVRTFTEEILRVVCAQLNANYGVPLLKPCLFSR